MEGFRIHVKMVVVSKLSGNSRRVVSTVSLRRCNLPPLAILDADRSGPTFTWNPTHSMLTLPEMQAEGMQ